MNEKRLKQLFDYQRFVENSAMNFAIRSARSYIDSIQSSTFELDDEELDMVNAAGAVDSRVILKEKELPLS